MPIAVPPIGAGGLGTPAVLAARPTDGTTAPKSGAQGAGFGNALAGAIDGLQQTQSSADELAIKAVTGNLADIHTATIAATRAQLMVELVSTVRNKGVDAFNEIMRMQA